MNIHILPDDLANQIAAGEVVERPASVVKELMENSIDAGATRIRVEIESAGKTLIRVIDNGSGMKPADARLAFERHATSKIGQPEDLAGIRTLGFRGEALPSIASIAQVRMTTCNGSGEAGTEVQIEGGGAPVFKETACSQGTTLEVRNLFFNTPARKKFLKADGTESGYITQVMQQQALAHPEIQFSLVHNGRKGLHTLSTDQILYRITELFGGELTKELVEVASDNGKYRIRGFVSTPIFTRSNRNAQYCFVNHRHIRDKVLLSATQMGYSHLLPKGQHPLLFLFLEMDPELLDVNVHPAKAEVRFAFQQEVHRFVTEAVHNALKNNVKGTVGLTDDAGIEASPGRTGWGAEPAIRLEETQARIPFSNRPTPPPAEAKPVSPGTEQALETFFGSASENCWERGKNYPRASHGIEALPQNLRAVSDLIYSEFEPLGQLKNSFIIMQGGPGILVVDQHIAHERVLYERFREAAREKKVDVQDLLFPLAMEFPPAETEVLNRHLDLLKTLGLELEPFGNQGFLLRSVPAILKKQDHEQMVRDIVESLTREDPRVSLQTKYEEVMIMMACRNAIKINHPMGLDQIRKLIYDLELTEMPFTCPHGRPIALLMEMDDLLKKFHRK